MPTAVMPTAAVAEPTTAPVADPVADVADETRVALPWRVILFDDDIHTFEDVIVQLMLATSCSADHAARIAFTVHTTGKAVCFEGSFEACFRVKNVLDEIALVTQIEG